MGLRYARNLSQEESRSLGEFWHVLDANRSAVDEEILRVARSIPAFAAVLSHLDERQLSEQSQLSQPLERAALLDGDWEAYIRHLRAQGERYAHLGIELRDWFPLVGAYRRVILGIVPHEQEGHFARVLQGMDCFIDIVMSTIGSAYVEAKEAAARTAEQKVGLYIDMFRNSSVGMAIYSCEGGEDLSTFRLVAVNPAAAQTAGEQILAAVGKTVGETHPALLDSDNADHFLKTLRRREPQRWEVTVGDRPERRWYECRSVPLGEHHMGVLFENISDRRRAELELERRARELERSNKALDEFAYVASHDLKAPLRDIQNLASWIEEDAARVLPQESARHLAQLRDRASRMERLLSDLLSYSRAGRESSVLETVDLREAVQCAGELASVPPSFTLEVRGTAAPLRVSRAPLEQVLRNLLSNAVKHHGRDDGHIVVSIEEHGEEVELSISDDGPGIPAHCHERVFRMFQTLRPRDAVEGSGMGLAIVKRVVDAHGGRIMLESSVGRGTTVRFTWPKQEGTRHADA